MRLLLDARVSSPRIAAALRDPDHGEFGMILRALDALLEERSDPDDWRNYTCFVARARSDGGADGGGGDL